MRLHETQETQKLNKNDMITTIGSEADVVVGLVSSIEAMSIALYGPDLTNTALQEMCAELVKATVVNPSQWLSAEQKV